MNLNNISTKELFLELIKRPEVLDIARAYGFGNELNTAFDSYEIKLNFHLSNEEWNKHFQKENNNANTNRRLQTNDI